MPKMKTKSGAAKRFKVRSSGGIKRSQAFKRHILTKKTTKSKRQLRGMTEVHAADEKLPAHTLGDRVAWIVVEGEVNYNGEDLGPGGLIYPESLVDGSQVPDKDGLAIVDREVGVMDLIATMCVAMGIDVSTQYTTPLGRPIKVVNEGAPITELT